MNLSEFAGRLHWLCGPLARVAPVLFILAAISTARCAEHPAPMPACLPLKQGQTIAFEGDSITYGQDESRSGVPTQINGGSQTRSPTPFPETMGNTLKGRVHILNRGFPGDRLRDGILRWKKEAAGDLNFILFGGNDALNNGHKPDGIIPVDVFERELTTYLRSPRFKRRQIVLLNEPPFVGDLNARVEPYREAIRQVGHDLGLRVVDTGLFLRSDPAPWTDGVHLKASAYKAIGEGLAALVCIQ